MSKKCPVCKGEIEEVEVPLMESRLGAETEVCGEEVRQYIKLKACKGCGLYVREEQDHD